MPLTSVATTTDNNNNIHNGNYIHEVPKDNKRRLILTLSFLQSELLYSF